MEIVLDENKKGRMERIEDFQRGVLLLLEKNHKEMNKKCGTIVSDQSEILTVEKFTQMMQKSLELIQKSNNVTFQDYEAVATQVAWMNEVLMTVAKLVGAATDGVVNGEVVGFSSLSLRNLFDSILEQRGNILAALEYAWKEAENEMVNVDIGVIQKALEDLKSSKHSDSPSTDQDAQVWSKLLGSHREKLMDGDSNAVLRFFLSTEDIPAAISPKDFERLETMLNSGDVANSVKVMYKAYENKRNALNALYSKLLIVPAVGFCVAGMASTTICCDIAAACHTNLCRKGTNLMKAAERREAENQLASITARHAELLGSIHDYFQIASTEFTDVDGLASKGNALIQSFRSNAREVKLVRELFKYRSEVAHKEAQERKIFFETLRWLGIGVIFAGTTVTTYCAFVFAAVSSVACAALGTSASPSAVALGITGATGALTAVGATACLNASSHFKKRKAELQEIHLNWEENVEYLDVLIQLNYHFIPH